MSIDWFIRLFFYGWALYETGVLLSTFVSVKNTANVKAYLVLVTNILVLVISYMLISTLTALIPQGHYYWKMLILIPLCYVSYSLRKVRKSLKS